VDIIEFSLADLQICPEQPSVTQSPFVVQAPFVE
jgi:hypothetical protein